MDNKRDVFINSLRERGEAPHSQDTKKRPISGTKHTKKKYTGRIVALILAGTLAIVGGKRYHDYTKAKDNFNDIASSNLEEIIVSDSYNKLTENTDRAYAYDAETNEFTYKTNCTRPNVYEVLNQTDIDEELNKYIAGDSTNKKDLQKRIDEINELNENLIKASLADSLGIDDLKDIYIIPQILSNSFIGERLQIRTPDEWLEAFCSFDAYQSNYRCNYEEIPQPLFRLIQSVGIENYYKNNDFETTINNYKNIKYILGNGYNLSIKDNKLVVVDDKGKEYSISYDTFGYKFNEVIEKQQEDEGR